MAKLSVGLQSCWKEGNETALECWFLGLTLSILSFPSDFYLHVIFFFIWIDCIFLNYYSIFSISLEIIQHSTHGYHRDLKVWHSFIKVHPKGDQSWVFTQRTDAEAETPNTSASSWEKLTHWKRPWCWEGLGAGGEGNDRGWDGWMASLTRWTWVWANSGSWW